MQRSLARRRLDQREQALPLDERLGVLLVGGGGLERAPVAFDHGPLRVLACEKGLENAHVMREERGRQGAQDAAERVVQPHAARRREDPRRCAQQLGQEGERRLREALKALAQQVVALGAEKGLPGRRRLVLRELLRQRRAEPREQQIEER